MIQYVLDVFTVSRAKLAKAIGRLRRRCPARRIPGLARTDQQNGAADFTTLHKMALDASSTMQA
jgi:hypothetical protein